ncbi:MAG: MotA/TolQ/ExbB proton channel family protein [Gammaproteobacteria bacterium]|nr:MotA/TolQ/ExbB proton channel family protein [Gammaproteobacteria bacterium]
MPQYPGLSEAIDAIIDLTVRGGPLIPLIMLTSLLLWTLIIERYWFYRFRYPSILARTVAQWNLRIEQQSWYARRIREGMISELSVALRRGLIPIKTLAAVLPLLGLLGTVTGMVATFDILQQYGNSNPQALSSGISKALLPTTAGLVTAIAALFFSINLQQRAETEINRVRDKLV